jgi:hypothetical protein
MKKKFSIYDCTLGRSTCVGSIVAGNGKNALRLFLSTSITSGLWEIYKMADGCWEAYSTYGRRLVARPSFNPDLA